MEAEGALTYEELFDLVRREKGNDYVIELADDFYLQFISYLKQKEESLTRGGSFSDVERSKIQFKNAKGLFKELFQRRERKIINLALQQARLIGSDIDTGALLSHEKIMFNEFAAIFGKFKRGILDNVLNLSMPSLAGGVQDAFGKVKKKKFKEAVVNEEENYIDLTEEKIEKSPVEDVLLVKFVIDVPKFMGRDLKVYGPYKKDEMVNLNSEVAGILIENKKAMEVEE
jgi:DNA replication initiation complex subunit (GINS family)